MPHTPRARLIAIAVRRYKSTKQPGYFPPKPWAPLSYLTDMKKGSAVSRYIKVTPISGIEVCQDLTLTPLTRVPFAEGLQNNQGFIKTAGENGETIQMHETTHGWSRVVYNVDGKKTLIEIHTGGWVKNTWQPNGKLKSEVYGYVGESGTEERYYDEFGRMVVRKTPLSESRTEYRSGGISIETVLTILVDSPPEKRIYTALKVPNKLWPAKIKTEIDGEVVFDLKFDERGKIVSVFETGEWRPAVRASLWSQFVLSYSESTKTYHAACRCFTYEEAIRHWGARRKTESGEARLRARKFYNSIKNHHRKLFKSGK